MKISLRRDFLSIYAVVCMGAVIFTLLSAGTLILQQRIVDVTRETRDQMVPEIQTQFRVVRNIELMRSYGNDAYRATDSTVRLKAGFLSTILTSHPNVDVDSVTYQLFKEANDQIQSLAKVDANSATWPDMNRRLAAHADHMSIVAETMNSSRAEQVGKDAEKIRNFAMAQTLLFLLSTAAMFLSGRVLLSRMKIKNKYFNELSHDFLHRVHTMELSLEVAVESENWKMEMGRIQMLMGDLHRYLNNFLDVARMETVAVKPVIMRFELFDLFQQLAVQFEGMAEHRQVDLRFRYSALHLESDEKLLRRILENLIVNALKFSRSKVLVAARRKGPSVHILVMDNGRGMQEKIISDHPSQETNATHGSDHGFGLGLTIVKHALETLGGYMNVRSVVNCGTMVRIELPVCR